MTPFSEGFLIYHLPTSAVNRYLLLVVYPNLAYNPITNTRTVKLMLLLQKIFEEKYIPEPNSGCWLWIGHIDNHGYGLIAVNKRSVRAHRLSWEIYNGKIPKGDGYHGTCVLHQCDNPACVNPSHLFLGTQSENMRDMVSKNRHQDRRGEKNTNAFLAEDQIILIRQLAKLPKGRFPQRVIAKLFGTSRTHVSQIKTGNKWACL